MKIPTNIFLFIDIAIGIIYLINIIESYKKGLLYEAVKLVFNLLAIYVAYRIGTIMAVNYPLINIDLGFFNGLMDINSIANVMIWFVIAYVVLKIILLIVLPLLKFLTKIPIIGTVNKIGGLIFGFINATIIVMLLSLILSLPFITNANEVKENTLIKYVSGITDFLKETISDNTNIDFDDFNISDITNYIDEKTMDSYEEVKDFIDELGIESIKDIDIKDLTDSQKEKFLELYNKYKDE